MATEVKSDIWPTELRTQMNSLGPWLGSVAESAKSQPVLAINIPHGISSLIMIASSYPAYSCTEYEAWAEHVSSPICLVLGQK